MCHDSTVVDNADACLHAACLACHESKHENEALTYMTSIVMAKAVLTISTRKLMLTGWKLNFPAAFLLICTRTGCSPAWHQNQYSHKQHYSTEPNCTKGDTCA